jgi:hypothetical protein
VQFPHPRQKQSSLPHDPLHFWEVLVPLLHSIKVFLLFALTWKKLHKIFQSHTGLNSVSLRNSPRDYAQPMIFFAHKLRNHKWANIYIHKLRKEKVSKHGNKQCKQEQGTIMPPHQFQSYMSLTSQAKHMIPKQNSSLKETGFASTIRGHVLTRSSWSKLPPNAHSKQVISNIEINWPPKRKLGPNMV